MAISSYVKKNYGDIKVISREKPDTIQDVLARIQDREYSGAGNYNVHLDIWGTESDGAQGQKENLHYTTLCSFNIAEDSEGSPLPTLNEPLILTKQKF